MNLFRPQNRSQIHWNPLLTRPFNVIPPEMLHIKAKYNLLINTSKQLHKIKDQRKNKDNFGIATHTHMHTHMHAHTHAHTDQPPKNIPVPNSPVSNSLMW